MNKIILMLVFAWPALLGAQELRAFVLYDTNGNEIPFDSVKARGSAAEVILFGELHDNAIAHWLQLELFRSLHEQHGEKLLFGAEMLEADNQVLIDEFLCGMIPAKTLKAEANLWPNHSTDYQPMLDYAKDNHIPVIATNIPRRYASLTYHHGPDTLSVLDKSVRAWISPLPLKYDTALPGYASLKNMGGGHGGQWLADAQAIKDATMAHFILEHLKKNHLFYHLNGAYHSNHYEGIYWFLKEKKPGLRILTITTVTAANPTVFDPSWKYMADIILVVDEDMTSTH